MSPAADTRPIYWEAHGRIWSMSGGKERMLPEAEARTLLTFYRTEGPKADRASADYMARCFRELHDAVRAVRRAAA